MTRSGVVRIFAGEDSVGSWMSGVLLIISSTVAAAVALRRGWYPWFPFAIFFLLLAVDENFMIHEAMKRSIVFVTYERTNHAIYWMGELPVVVAAGIGAAVAWVLSRNIDRTLRWLIGIGVLFGSCSVVIDILSVGVFWEDSCKLAGELAVTCALVEELEGELSGNS